MSKTHVVRQGESLGSIARQYGFSAKALYEHPANRALREKRPSADVLFPGDEVTIPDRKSKTIKVATGSTTEIKLANRSDRLKLKLVDRNGKPLANREYRLTLGKETRVGKTNGDGLLEAELGAGQSDVQLEMEGVSRRIRVGHLNPMSQTPDNGISGVQARLRNLGYDAGNVDGVWGPRTEHAIKAFQHDHGEKETGIIDADLIRAITREHGC